MRKGQDSQSACDDDPGAIIARALRQKFSNRVFRDSPGEIAFPLIYDLCRAFIRHMLHVQCICACTTILSKSFVRLAQH